jgi:hypothetical protein
LAWQKSEFNPTPGLRESWNAGGDIKQALRRQRNVGWSSSKKSSTIFSRKSEG